MTTTTTRTETAIAFQTALSAVKLDQVPVMTLDRSISRKDQAALARKLFRALGIKGISVTTPNYSMAQSVDVSIPSRQDYAVEYAGTVDWKSDPASQANHAARQQVKAILAIAFPNHDDRSDSQSDHFDYKWSID